jgi:DinB family protein
MTPVDVSPDPVAEPAAYQTFLLALLGDDDPASAQESTAAVLKELAKEAGNHLYQQPAPGEWSVGQVVAHLSDAEIAMSGRYRWILAHDEPALMGYDQDLWVERLHDGKEPVEDLIEVFESLRKANVALWRRSGPKERARVGIHSERGPESFDLCFRMIAGHDRLHQGQIRRALEVVNRS